MEHQGTGRETANVLIVDDITSNLIILTEMIKSARYIARPVTSAKQAITAIQIKMPQLILLDISMPDMDGYEFCEILKKNRSTRDIPIIFISAMNAKEDKIKGFQLGAVDFISKPFELEEVTLRVNNHLKLYKMQQELEIYNKRLHKMVGDQIKKITEEEKDFLLLMARLSELKENPNSRHVENISKNCTTLAMAMQLSKKFEKEISNSFLDKMETACTLHDLGKIYIPDYILLKPARVTEIERDILKTHAKLGGDMLLELYQKTQQNEILDMAVEIAYYHHERWDGEGYPMGLKREEIPLSARIMAVVDVYDALTSKRCYKAKVSKDEGVRIINEGAGKAFDPEIVRVFNKIHGKFQAK